MHTKRLYEVTALATATAEGPVFYVKSNDRGEGPRAVGITITGTATVKILGALAADRTYTQIGSDATETGIEFLNLPPFFKVSVSGAAGQPDIAVDVDASMTPVA